MALLFDEDYQILADSALLHEEDETNRFFVFKNFPLPHGIYRSQNSEVNTVDVLYVIPQNYNTDGGDMFWVSPQLYRIDGVEIPATGGPGSDSRLYNQTEFCRWSRHWNNSNSWKPKTDNIKTIIDRISWAFKYPDAKRS